MVFSIDFGNKQTFDTITEAKTFAKDNNITNYRLFKSIYSDLVFFILEW